MERALAALLLRGPGADHVLGDLEEQLHHDLRRGLPPRQARARFRRHVLTSALAWWRPDAVLRRRSAPVGREASTTLVPRRSSRAKGSWPHDARIAMRSFLRRPGFAAGVAVTLGIGIGATTTIFSVVDGVLLKPLPYDDADRLVAAGTTFPTRPWADESAGLQQLAGMSMLNYQDFRARARAYDALAALEVRSVLLPDFGNGPELVPAALVSAEVFGVLGASPALGRTFLPDEHSVRATPVVVLSFGAWQRRYAGDPGIVGRTVDRVSGPATVVGVLPADFTPPEAFLPSVPDFWFPLSADDPRYESRGMRSLALVGRLRTGMTVEAARAEAQAIADQLAIAFPDGNVYPDGSHFGIGVNGLRQHTVGSSARALRLFLGASALMLLLSALNAGALILSRTLERSGELGVRQALGAGRGRVIRLLLTEAVLLSVAGGILGTAIAFGGVEVFLRYAPSEIPRLGSVAVDGRVLRAAALIALATGITAGALPAARITRSDLWTRLGGAGRSVSLSSSRVHTALVAGQFGVATLLLTGSALLGASFLELRSVDPGFAPEGLITLRVDVKRLGHDEEPAWRAWDGLLARVRAVPGVEAAAGTTNPPFQDPFWAPRLLLSEDRPDVWREGIAGYSITPGYLETVGTRLIAGRDLLPGDGPDAEAVALVNQAFVRTQLGGVDPIGVMVTRVEDDRSTPLRIVGLVEDVVQAMAQQGPRPAIYVPHTQTDWPFVQVMIRTALPDSVLVPSLRRAVAGFSPLFPLRDVRTMEDRMAATRIAPRFHSLLVGAFAIVGLALAAGGLFGSLSRMVGCRRKELGIRMALGAGEASVSWIVLRQGLWTSGAGLAVGVGASLAGGRMLSGFLYGVSPVDPGAFIWVTAVLGLVSVVACLVPARRAIRVDPIQTLRAD